MRKEVKDLLHTGESSADAASSTDAALATHACHASSAPCYLRVSCWCGHVLLIHRVQLMPAGRGELEERYRLYPDNNL